MGSSLICKWLMCEIIVWALFIIDIKGLVKSQSAAGVPKTATRGTYVFFCEHMACVVLCLVSCALCSLIVCPLIIVSVSPPVSTSLPSSFISLFILQVSAVLCWSVVICQKYLLYVWYAHTALHCCALFLYCLPACFSKQVLLHFVSFYYYYKKLPVLLLHLSPCLISLPVTWQFSNTVTDF